MAYNVLRGDRDQPFLLPPDPRDWLPDGHLAWFVLDVVDQLDLDPFMRAYRADGHGHPAYDPKTLLGVLLYAYAIGVRSSRQIERRCYEDLAFRVLAGNQAPDHVTVARFRVRHEQALAGFLVASLRLCAAAGLVRLGVVALDGTKVAANAAGHASPAEAAVPTSVSCACPRYAPQDDPTVCEKLHRSRGEVRSMQVRRCSLRCCGRRGALSAASGASRQLWSPWRASTNRW